MQTFITSDLHLGLKQCRVDDFIAFLENLPAGARLVLNGDTITHFYSDATLCDEHKAVVAKLRDASFEREVIWIRGNNDKRVVLSDPGNIKFAKDFSIGKQLYISHGHRYDWIMPSTRAIMIPVRLIYYAIAKYRKSKMHVAEYAKRFSALYSILCRHVAWNAAHYARRHGYEAVTCGHTHYSEDRMVSGIRYLNTGCWTENDSSVVIVEDGNIRLVTESVL